MDPLPSAPALGLLVEGTLPRGNRPYSMNDSSWRVLPSPQGEMALGLHSSLNQQAGTQEVIILMSIINISLLWL